MPKSFRVEMMPFAGECAAQHALYFRMNAECRHETAFHVSRVLTLCPLRSKAGCFDMKDPKVKALNLLYFVFLFKYTKTIEKISISHHQGSKYFRKYDC